jgi:hypothetical protein
VGSERFFVLVEVLLVASQFFPMGLELLLVVVELAIMLV